jgi:hypothetical protein
MEMLIAAEREAVHNRRDDTVDHVLSDHEAQIVGLWLGTTPSYPEKFTGPELAGGERGVNL